MASSSDRADLIEDGGSHIPAFLAFSLHPCLADDGDRQLARLATYERESVLGPPYELLLLLLPFGGQLLLLASLARHLRRIRLRR